MGGNGSSSSNADVTREGLNSADSCGNWRLQLAACRTDEHVGGSSQDASRADGMEDPKNECEQ